MNSKLDFSLLLQQDYLNWILAGLATMIELTLLAWIVAMVIGTVLAVIRMSNNRFAQYFVAAYVEYHQNIPILVQIFLWYFGIASLFPDTLQSWFNLHNSEFIFAFVAIGLCMGAYISEDLRAGIRSIPKAQLEAARALGLSYLKSAKLVVLPQALRIALPTMINHTVLLFKNTSLAMAIGVAELTYVTREIESQSFKTVETYLFSTAIYLIFSLIIISGGTLLEKKYKIKTR